MPIHQAKNFQKFLFKLIFAFLLACIFALISKMKLIFLNHRQFRYYSNTIFFRLRDCILRNIPHKTKLDDLIGDLDLAKPRAEVMLTSSLKDWNLIGD